MYNLFGCKKWLIVVFVGWVFMGMSSIIQAQPVKINNPNYELKQWIHFGITLGLNSSNFRVKRSEDFIHNDTVLAVESDYGPGFNLGIISNLHMGEYFDFRFIPALSFAEKRLTYTEQNDNIVEKSVQSTYVDFPFHFKFKSDRFDNNRIYVMGGGKYSIDLASKAHSREAEEKVKIFPSDASFEYGIGFDHYFPMFKFSLELKVSHGVRDVLKRENHLIYSRVLNKLYSRTFLFSLHFE